MSNNSYDTFERVDLPVPGRPIVADFNEQSLEYP